MLPQSILAPVDVLESAKCAGAKLALLRKKDYLLEREEKAKSKNEKWKEKRAVGNLSAHYISCRTRPVSLQSLCIIGAETCPARVAVPTYKRVP